MSHHSNNAKGTDVGSKGVPVSANSTVNQTINSIINSPIKTTANVRP